MLWLAGLFLGAAALYASVGFGGGSTYIALLALAETDYRLLPIVALSCNIVVVTGGTLRFALAGQVPWKRIAPIAALSVPAAWIGGRLPIDEQLFLAILAFALLVAGILLLAAPSRAGGEEKERRLGALWVGAPLGAGIGFVSGLVGIGGGIFLSPILLLMRWAEERRVAASASVFILVNSLAGLAGQMSKWGTGGQDFAALAAYWPLPIAVLIGGQIGSLLASRKLPQRAIRRLTAILVLFVAVRLLLQL